MCRYEDLVQHTEVELSRMLSFLGQNVSQAVMSCALRQREGPMRRKDTRYSTVAH